MVVLDSELSFVCSIVLKRVACCCFGMFVGFVLNGLGVCGVVGGCVDGVIPRSFGGFLKIC